MTYQANIVYDTSKNPEVRVDVCKRCHRTVPAQIIIEADSLEDAEAKRKELLGIDGVSGIYNLTAIKS